MLVTGFKAQRSDQPARSFLPPFFSFSLSLRCLLVNPLGNLGSPRGKRCEKPPEFLSRCGQEPEG